MNNHSEAAAIISVNIIVILMSILFIGMLISVTNEKKDLKNQITQLTEQNQTYETALSNYEQQIRRLEMENKMQKEDILYEIEEHKVLFEEYMSLVEQIQDLRKELVNDSKIAGARPYDANDLEILYRLAAAEAGYKDKQAEKNIVYVVLNRVNSTKFPNTVSSVVDQPGQFGSGLARLKNIKIDNNVKDAVNEAFTDYVYGESAQGALYFGRSQTGGNTYLFTDSIGHVFYK